MNEPTGHIFDKMTQLALDIDWPINSFDFLSTLVDCSQLSEIWLFLSIHHYFESNTMSTLLDLAYNVRTLGISYDDDSTPIPADTCSVISRQIEHLKVRTTYAECMQLVLECVEHLSSVTFIRDRGSTILSNGLLRQEETFHKATIIKLFKYGSTERLVSYHKPQLVDSVAH
jgi:hypothetical protein